MEKFIPNRRFYLRGSAFFALINLLVVWAIATRYLPWLEAPAEPWGIAYLATTWTGHFGMLVMLAWLPMGLLALMLRGRLLIAALTLLASIGLSALVLDTVVFAQYQLHLDQFMHSPTLPEGSGGGISAATWAIGVGVIAVVLFFEAWLAWRIIGRAQSIRFPVWKGFLALLILAVASHVIHIVADARYKPDVTAQANIYPMLFPATARGIMKEHGWLDPRVEHGDKPGETALDQRSSAASDAGRHTGAGT